MNFTFTLLKYNFNHCNFIKLLNALVLSMVVDSFLFYRRDPIFSYLQTLFFFDHLILHLKLYFFFFKLRDMGGYTLLIEWFCPSHYLNLMLQTVTGYQLKVCRFLVSRFLVRRFLWVGYFHEALIRLFFSHSAFICKIYLKRDSNLGLRVSFYLNSKLTLLTAWPPWPV